MERTFSGSPVDLSESVALLAPALRRLVGDCIEVSIALTSEPATILADPTETELLVIEQAAAARDAMPGGGKLFIEISRTVVDEPFAALSLAVPVGEYIVLAMTDTGAGFARGVRAKPNGCFVSEHNIAGIGTVVRAIFPVAAASGDALLTADADAGLSGTETILLVEDEPAIRRYLRLNLAQRGYDVLDAANGEEAALLASRHRGPIDLLLIDMGLPDANGAEIARSIGNLRPGILVLRMSAHSEPPGMDRSFMQKPFTLSALLLNIRAMLDSRPATEYRPVRS